jgi:hypothetical protein
MRAALLRVLALFRRRQLERGLDDEAQTHFDPATFVGVALLFGGVAVSASYLPARCAPGVDPAVTLRSD